MNINAESKKMKIVLWILTVMLAVGCSSNRVTINGLICPEGFSTHQVQKDLTECQYYDEKKAAEASQSPIKPECRQCLEEKGYEIK